MVLFKFSLDPPLLPRQQADVIWTQNWPLLSFYYRAMHFSAKRGIAIACRLSVCLSVCDVGEL